MKVTNTWVLIRCACLLAMTIIFSSCEEHIPFEKNKWSEQTDPAFPSPYRKPMLQDLLKNRKLEGMTCSAIRDTLGKPDGADSNYYAYRIVEEYGRGIDPVYIKHLMLYYSKDSIVTKVDIDEWKAK